MNLGRRSARLARVATGILPPKSASGPPAADHDVIEVIFQVLLDLLLVLGAGHLRHVDDRFVAHPYHLVLALGLFALCDLWLQDLRLVLGRRLA